MSGTRTFKKKHKTTREEENSQKERKKNKSSPKCTKPRKSKEGETSSSGSITAFFQRLSGDNNKDKFDGVQEDRNSSNKKEDSKTTSHKKSKHKKIKEQVDHTSISDKKDFEEKNALKEGKHKKYKTKRDVQMLANDGDYQNSHLGTKQNYKDVIEVTSVQPTKEIKNVFSFMMESRHKVIGQNSPGKDSDKLEETSIQNEDKQKLAARKALFKTWSDAKGAKKRKVEEEEIGVTIEHKLKKRAKRLKNMLTQSDLNDASTIEEKSAKDVSSSDDDIFVKRSKRVSLICINSDNSNSADNTISEAVVTKSFHQTELSSFFGILDNTRKINKEHESVKVDKDSNKESFSVCDLQQNQYGSFDIDKHINENSFTPRSKKKWQMRLKLSINDMDDRALQSLVENYSVPKITPSKNISLKSTNDYQVLKSETNNSDSITDLGENTFDITSAESNNDEFFTKSRTDSKQTDPSTKIAPVFLKAVSKPKPDKETLTARKLFLESGIPEELKRVQEKQQKFLNRAPMIFPSISHITVMPDENQINNPINFWNLPKAFLDLQTETKYIPETYQLVLGTMTSSKFSEVNSFKIQDLSKVFNIKEEIKRMKKENPHYPVFKSYKIFSKAYLNSIVDQETPKKLKKPRKRRSRNKSLVKEDKPQMNVVQCKLWTDIYKPTSSEEMFSNYSNVKTIRKWVETWLNCNSGCNTTKHKKYDSSSEFESTDIDSRDSCDLPRNTLILSGPPGSGKTSAVHAVCSELGIIILESNASSKRTGKVLLQQLQQVSQAYELQGIVHDFITNECEIKVIPKKTRLLLIEDVDIMFDQDESFLSAINQLISTSRHPIILTTTDINCLHLKKLISRHTIIKFLSVSSKISSPWLQIVCLVEGVCLSRQYISDLLQDYNGDVRRALLYLQFIIRGTENASGTNNLINADSSINDDVESSISSIAKDETYVEDCLHNNIDELIGKVCDEVNPLDLGQIWWNIPQLVNILPALNIQKSYEINHPMNTNLNNLKVREDSIGDTIQNTSKTFLQVYNVFEACALTDLLYTNIVDSDLEPANKNRTNYIKGSLEETASSESCYFNRDLAVQISRTLLSGCVVLRRSSTDVKIYRGIHEKRWRTKQYKCEEKLLAAVPATHHLDRTALADYLSTLRTISKSEDARANVSNKRNNRFYNYLSGLGISTNESILKTANNAFMSDNCAL